MAEIKSTALPPAPSVAAPFTSSGIVTMGVPIAVTAAVGIYFYQKNNANLARITELETKIKTLEEIVSKHNEKINNVVSNWQQAFGSMQNQMALISSQQQQVQQPQPMRYKSQNMQPPQYSPDEEDLEDAPREAKKKAKGIAQSSNIKEQVDQMARERGSQ